MADWEKADLQPASDASPAQIAVAETVIRLNGQQYRLYAVVTFDSNKFLQVWLFPTITTEVAERFLQELRAKHDIEDAVFLVDHAQRLKTALQRVGLRFQTVRHGNRNAIERVCHKIKGRTSSFSTSLATSSQQQRNRGCKPSPSGGTR